jgi:hypothetical protein
MDKHTRRELLITQLRMALGELTSPFTFKHDTSIVFTIGDMEFEYTEEDLKETIHDGI